MKFNAILFLLLALALFSCGSRKDVVYFQNILEQAPKLTDETESTVKIAPNDVLMINVLTQNPAIMAQFNSVNLDRGSIQTTSLELLGYLVDEKGEINFPVVGKIMVAGFTKSEIVNMIQEKLAKYIEEPVVVNLRLINYKVTVLGEVNRPGNFTITDEKVSIPEALALAGDLTIYGDRHQVLLMRTDNGQKEFYTLDLTNPAIVFSPLYFLKQNDILYISPNKAKAGNATYSQAVPMIISLVGVALTITSIIINVSK